MNSELLKKFIFPLYHKIKRTRVMERLNELDANQWKSRDELANLQSIKLKRLLRYANDNVPYYREKFKKIGINVKDLHHFENFIHIPLLTKKEINEKRERLISTKINCSDLIANSTSGSTGEALFFFNDKRSWAYRRATVIRNEAWLGIKLGDKSVRLWGAPMDLKKASAIRGKLHSWANNILFFSSYNLMDEKLAEYEKILRRFKPKLIISYPGPLTVFAEYLLKNNKKIQGIKAIICSAETLYPWQRDICERAFHCAVFNRYGCREFGDIAQECVKREGLHIHSELFYVEILNEKLQPVSEGERGELVITDLENFGMPFIRYRIGDIASFKKELCSCGRSLPLLSKLDGRTLDIVQAPNGNRLGGTFWTILFKNRPGIRSFQVVQERLDEVYVNYIKDTQVEEIDFSWFEKSIKEKCGPNLMIYFKEVKDIPKTTSGKTRIIVSKLEK